MLSQKEIEFLKEPSSFSPDYSYVLKHKIKNKVLALNEELELLRRELVLLILVRLRKTARLNQAQKKLLLREEWWGLPDLNRSL
jgi:hypothetical protein